MRIAWTSENNHDDDHDFHLSHVKRDTCLVLEQKSNVSVSSLSLKVLVIVSSQMQYQTSSDAVPNVLVSFRSCSHPCFILQVFICKLNLSQLYLCVVAVYLALKRIQWYFDVAVLRRKLLTSSAPHPTRVSCVVWVGSGSNRVVSRLLSTVLQELSPVSYVRSMYFVCIML